MRSPRIATAVLALVSTATALAAAELVLRSARTLVSDKPSEFLVPHGVLGWARPPDARFRYVIDGVPHEVAWNARGFRDVERPPGAVAPGGERVVLLGDSFMEAYSVPLEATFARQLEARLRRDRPGVEVVNLGVSGYGTLQETLVYQLEGRSFSPALVLLGFYLHNDLRENSLELESLRRSVSRSTDRPFLLPESDPGPGSDPEWRLSAVDVDGSLARYRAALARRRSWWWRAGEASQIWRLTGAAWIDAALRALDETPATDPGEDPLSRRERIALELDVFACQPRAEYERAWEITARILARLDREVRADGAHLVVFSVPSVYESLPRLPDAGSDPDPPELACRHAPPYLARLRGILADLRVPFIDLLPAFQRHARDPAERLFAGDSHWSAAGHALAAGEVARGLRELDLARLSPGAPPDPRSDPATPGASR